MYVINVYKCYYFCFPCFQVFKVQIFSHINECMYIWTVEWRARHRFNFILFSFYCVSYFRSSFGAHENNKDEAKQNEHWDNTRRQNENRCLHTQLTFRHKKFLFQWFKVRILYLWCLTVFFSFSFCYCYLLSFSLPCNKFSRKQFWAEEGFVLLFCHFLYFFLCRTR